MTFCGFASSASRIEHSLSSSNIAILTLELCLCLYSIFVSLHIPLMELSGQGTVCIGGMGVFQEKNGAADPLDRFGAAAAGCWIDLPNLVHTRDHMDLQTFSDFSAVIFISI